MKRLLFLILATGLGACAGKGKLTESQEYYVGRGVAANAVLQAQGVRNDMALEDYVNWVGMTIALESDRPETYKGYHFGVLNSPEVNAFAAPGGFIFVTAGAIRNMKNEDELAGVIAHEIAHVNIRHPEEFANRETEKTGAMDAVNALASIGSGILTAIGQQDKAELVDELTPHFGKVLDEMMQGLYVNGYGRASELEADALAAKLVVRAGVGYDPGALRDFISRLPKKERGAWGSHPGLEGRVQNLTETISTLKRRPKVDPARTQRFRAITAGLRGS